MTPTIPPEGFNITHLAALAITRGVLISFGVSGRHKALATGEKWITVQVQRKEDEKPVSFAMPFDPLNMMLGRAMSVALLSHIDKVAPKKTLVIQP